LFFDFVEKFEWVAAGTVVFVEERDDGKIA